MKIARNFSPGQVDVIDTAVREDLADAPPVERVASEEVPPPAQWDEMSVES